MGNYTGGSHISSDGTSVLSAINHQFFWLDLNIEIKNYRRFIVKSVDMGWIC